MASFTLTAADRFPVGTSVSAYPASNWQAFALPPSGAPAGASVATATVATSGSVAFTGLADGMRYFAYALVSGEHRYVQFSTDKAATSGTGLPAGGAVGDVVTNTAPGVGSWSPPVESLPFEGTVTKELTASLTGDTDVRASLGVLGDDLYMAASSGSSPGLHGVKRLRKGQAAWETLTTFGAGVGIATGIGGAIAFRGKLYFGGWGATPGAIYRLDLAGDGSFSAFTTMTLDAGAEDVHPHHVLWGNLWMNTYANAALFASSGIGAGLWRWDGVAASAVQVVNSEWLGANAFANGHAFHQGRLWVSIIDFTSVYGELWSVGSDFVARREWRGHTAFEIAEWNGELVAMKAGANSPLYVWRNGQFVAASPASNSGGVTLGPLISVGDRLMAFNYYTGPMRYTRDGSFTQLTLPANSATGHGSPVMWNKALWWLTTAGEQCVFKLPLGQDTFNRELLGRQHKSGGAGRIADAQVPFLGRDLVVDTAASGFVQKCTDRRYRRLSLASGAAVVSDLDYSAPNPDAPYAPACTAPPTVTGTPYVGNTLTCSAGTWTNIAVTGAAATDLFTAANHGLSAGDRVAFWNLTGGAGITAGTAYFVIASGLTSSTFKVSATLAGSALDVTSDLTAGQIGRLSYQWYRDGVAIPTATAATRLLAAADATHTLLCVVTASNANGFASADSNAMAVSTAPPPLQPSAILGANLFQHHRAEDETGADNAVLAQATDLSGNARHLTMSTVGKRALKKTAIVNGKAVYRFDGTDDRFTRDHGSVIAQTLEIYVVCQMRTGATGGAGKKLIIGDFGGGRALADWTKAGGSIQAYAGSFSCNDPGSSSLMSDRFHAWGFKFAGASSQIVKDGIVLVTGDGGTGGLQYLSVGADAIDGSIADIDIAEIVVANAALTTQQRADLLYYFQYTYATP